MSDQQSFLSQAYRRRFAGQDAYRDAVWRILCNDFFSPLLAGRDTVLELGAGWGEFSNNLGGGRTQLAMDLNPDTAQRLADHVRFLHQDCSEPWPLADGSLDAVFTSNFLEHLPDKAAIARTLAEAYRCLRAGGRMICLGPNIKYVPGAYWDFWDHYVPLTEQSMGEALESAGFALERVVPRFLPYSMAGGRNPPLLFVRAYLRLRLAWPLFGRQFLVCAGKPGDESAAAP